MNNSQRPKSTERTIVAFEELIRKDDVVEGIRKFRDIMGIPADGLEFTDEDREILTDRVLGTANCALWVPERLEVSDSYLSQTEVVENPKKASTGDYRMTIVHTSRALAASQGYTSERVFALMRLYVLFNKVIDIPLNMLENEDDLLSIEHLPTTLEEYDSEDHFLLKCAFKHFEYASKRYPVALYINPEASRAQVIDFINKKWDLIQKHRDEDTHLYSGKRKKQKQAVSDFIYKNKELPLAEIRSKLAAEMNEFLDDGHIGKILSIEKERRN